MKILVTGGSGFIGSHVAEYYANRNEEVVVFDNLSRAEILGANKETATYNWYYLKNNYTNVKLVEGDVRRFEQVYEQAKEADLIVHVAAQVAVTTSVKDPKTDFEINALGTFNVLEAARKAKTNPTIVYCSTNKVYGTNVNKIPVKEGETRYYFADEKYINGIPEDFPMDLCEHTPYGCSKLVGDLYVQDYAYTYGLKTAVFRMSCLTADTRILVNGSVRTIKEVQKDWKEQRVLTYDFNTKKLKYSPITMYMVNPPGRRRILEIMVESGKRVRATEDHLFYTNHGWKALKDIKPGDYVATYPPTFEFGKDEKTSEKSYIILLSEADIRKVAGNFLKRRAWVKWTVYRLKELNLLPLLNVNEKLPIIARLVGFLLGDGWLSVHIDRKNNTLRRQIGFVGKEEDLKSIVEDISRLGFNCRGKITTKYTNSSLTDGKNIKGNTTKLVCTSSALWFLLNALGVPVGEKSSQETYVPRWIFNSPLSVKKEFLAGFMGAEMSKPTWCPQRRCFQQPMICIRKILHLKDSGIEFAKQLSELFAQFKIRCKILVGKPYVRKDGRQTIGIYLVFPRDRKNLLRLCRIGFRYCKERDVEANIIATYIEHLFRSGINRSATPYPIWKTEHVKGLENTGLIWEMVKEVKPYTKNIKHVYDLTVNPTHNFIANGFLVHNCIYGERQFGVEDQGWVAWFTIATLTGKPITIYGDGKQVRDVLHVSDLIKAYDAFVKSNLKHEVFNIGGGPENTLSLIELLNYLKKITGKQTHISYNDWRPGDQKVYISNISKAQKKLNWKPKITPQEGVKKLSNWVKENRSFVFKLT